MAYMINYYIFCDHSVASNISSKDMSKFLFKEYHMSVANTYKSGQVNIFYYNIL